MPCSPGLPQWGLRDAAAFEGRPGNGIEVRDMRQPEERKLVVFDYSGTLSLEAPRFGQPDRLVRAFTESGLSALGVKTPDFFWDQIVNPTWIEGSTTPLGYKRVMAERVGSLAGGGNADEIGAAVSRFVDGYLDHSRIDPLWRGLLTRLAGFPGASVVIATDHYAEATGTIIRNLRGWGIPAQTVRDEDGVRSPFLIANSADIGFWKENRRFWEVLKRRISPEKPLQILLVDDFGYNEELGDRYGMRTAIEARREKTVAALRDVFRVELQVIPFFLARGAREDEVPLRIDQARERIWRFLNPAAGPSCEP